MNVQECPICEGREKVPAKFYDPGSTSTVCVMCRACGGKGIVVVSDRRPFWPTYPGRPAYIWPYSPQVYWWRE